MAWSIARAASLTKLRLHLSCSPIPPHLNPSTALLLSGNPISGRSSSLKILRNYVGLASPVYAQRFRSVFSMQKMIGRSFHLSGRKLFTGTFIGISILGGMLHRPSNIAYAMDDSVDYEEPSGYLKDDLNTFWALTRKFQLPVVLFFMVILGWRRPVTLAINIILLLFCTRPSPFSIYMFIEQKREKLAKESRAKQKYTHTSESKSFARKEEEIENTVGRVPGLVEMFELTHTKKNGSFISEEAKKLMADAKEKLASCSGTSESSRECMIAMENKIYIEIIRKEYGDRVGGLGMIPSESCVCYHSESTEEVQKLREEVQENKKMVSQLQSQLAIVMEFIRQKMPDCNLDGSSHDPESSGVRCTSASSNRSTDS